MVNNLNNDIAIYNDSIKIINSRFWFISIIEDYTNSLKLLCKLINNHNNCAGLIPAVLRGSNSKKSKQSKHKSNKPNSVASNENFRTIIEERNKIDMMIYNYVKDFYLSALKN